MLNLIVAVVVSSVSFLLSFIRTFFVQFVIGGVVGLIVLSFPAAANASAEVHKETLLGNPVFLFGMIFILAAAIAAWDTYKRDLVDHEVSWTLLGIGVLGISLPIFW